jgi:uncharacterized phage-associated protein
MTDDVHDVAAALLERVGSTTAWKLQKLAYYCQAWHLARTGTPLFRSPVEAWRDGPVVRELYDRHRQQMTVTSWPRGLPDRLSEAARETVALVVARYGRFTPAQLRELTHAEAPWRITRGGLPPSAASSRHIPVEYLRKYYGRQVLDPDEAVRDATASAALEGVELDDDWQRVMREVAAGELDPETVVAALLAEYQPDGG